MALASKPLTLETYHHPILHSIPCTSTQRATSHARTMGHPVALYMAILVWIMLGIL